MDNFVPYTVTLTANIDRYQFDLYDGYKCTSGGCTNGTYFAEPEWLKGQDGAWEWTAPAAAGDLVYTVEYRRTLGSPHWLPIAGITDTQYVFASLASGSWQFRVRAAISIVDGPWSAILEEVIV